MRKDGKPENQHYVPKMLLRPFSHKNGSEKVYVFDKHTSRKWPGATYIGKVLAERRYYDTENPYGQAVSLEHTLTALEDEAAPILARIREAQTLAVLSPVDRATLSVFIAVQLSRTPHLRAAYKQITDAILKVAKGNSPDAANLDEFEQLSSESALKFSSLLHVVDSAGYAPILDKHHWVLMRSKGPTFWTSDCPVVQHNDRTFGPYGNIGLAVPGIQIYMPISPQLVLALWERSVVADLRTQITELERAHRVLKATNTISVRPVDMSFADGKIAQLTGLLGCIDAGTAHDVDPENVTFSNSLQYLWSSRFLVSSDDDFSLAEKMASERPDLRDGMRLKIN